MIDKFGRSDVRKHSIDKQRRGPAGNGFKLTADDNFDLEKKRLTNIGRPIASNDAVTKEYLIRELLRHLKIHENKFNEKMDNIIKGFRNDMEKLRRPQASAASSVLPKP